MNIENGQTNTPVECFVMPPCADCGGTVGQDRGPKDGWQLEDGRTVCHACCVENTRKVFSYIERSAYACKVCGNVPDEDGTLEHGRGCFVMDANGGGIDFVEFD